MCKEGKNSHCIIRNEEQTERKAIHACNPKVKIGIQLQNKPAGEYRACMDQEEECQVKARPYLQFIETFCYSSPLFFEKV